MSQFTVGTEMKEESQKEPWLILQKVKAKEGKMASDLQYSLTATLQ